MKRAEVFERIRKFMMPPQFDDPEKNRRAHLVNILAWIGIVFLLYLIVSYIIEGYSLFDASSRMLEALFILILIIIWLNSPRKCPRGGNITSARQLVHDGI